MYAMKRTSLFLDAKILQALKRAARRDQVSVASLVREALSRYLAEPAAAARLPSVTGRFSSGMGDTAERADELLWRDPHA
jgi:Ribbon-helix-helix protein, copG family